MSGIKMTPVKSSNVTHVGYDEGSKTLAVKFNSGLYHYHGVEPHVHEGALGADSVGKYLRSKVIGQYKHSKIEEGK